MFILYSLFCVHKLYKKLCCNKILSAMCRMLLIAQNGLFHSISSNYWQKRYQIVVLLSTVFVGGMAPMLQQLFVLFLISK
jgi:hypothetical protein